MAAFLKNRKSGYISATVLPIGMKFGKVKEYRALRCGLLSKFFDYLLNFWDPILSLEWIRYDTIWYICVSSEADERASLI